MVLLVENQVIKENWNTNKGKNCLFIQESAEISSCGIRSLPDYDTDQCAESSHLKCTTYTLSSHLSGKNSYWKQLCHFRSDNFPFYPSQTLAKR